jgi:hypothetical protein
MAGRPDVTTRPSDRRRTAMPARTDDVIVPTYDI